MPHTIKKTWNALTWLQRISLVGLVFLAIAMPISILTTAAQTRTFSQALELTPALRSSRIDQTAEKRFDRLPQPVAVTGAIQKSGNCRIAGCNGELCLDINDKEINSTCEISDDELNIRSCRQKFARCETQSSGKCGWSYDQNFEACLQEDLNASPKNPTLYPTESQPELSSPMCGNNVCESGEATNTVCTKSIPAQCKQVSGSCPQDCITISQSPGDPRECTLNCRENQELDVLNCRCQNAKPLPEKIEESRKSNAVKKLLSACEATGGTLEQMSGCGDSCEIITNTLIACSDSDSSLKCNCGAESCWDGTACVRNPKKISRPSQPKMFGFESWFSGVKSFFDSFL